MKTDFELAFEAEHVRRKVKHPAAEAREAHEMMCEAGVYQGWEAFIKEHPPIHIPQIKE